MDCILRQPLDKVVALELHHIKNLILFIIIRMIMSIIKKSMRKIISPFRR